MGINPTGGMNIPPDSQGMSPDVYAQKFAEKNNISVDEAKKQLQARFGAPMQAPTTPISTEISLFAGQQTGKPLPTDMTQLAQYIKDGASKLNISEQEFAEKMGLPARIKPDQTDKTDELKKLGIPESIINQGDDAIRKYAQDHNIEIPKKEDN